MQKNFDKLMDQLIPEIGLQKLDRHEAECVALAWLLKTKLYAIGETSRKWSEEGRALLAHEVSSCQP